MRARRPRSHDGAYRTDTGFPAKKCMHVALLSWKRQPTAVTAIPSSPGGSGLHRPLEPQTNPVLSYCPERICASRWIRGQIVQEVQKQCRSEFPKVHCLPKLGRPSLSFGQCRKCGKCR